MTRLIGCGLISLLIIIAVANSPCLAEEDPFSTLPTPTYFIEADKLKDQGRYEEAANLLIEALAEVGEEVPGSSDHIELLTNLSSLYDIYLDDKTKSADYLEKAIVFYKRDNSPALVGALQMLGDLYFGLSRHEEGLALYEQSIEREIQEVGADSHLVWNDQKRLVRYYFDYQKWDKAEVLLLNMLEKTSHLEGEKKLSAAGILVNLATLYHDKNLPDKEQRYLQQAQHVIERGQAEFPDSPYTQMITPMLEEIQNKLKAHH